MPALPQWIERFLLASVEFAEAGITQIPFLQLAPALAPTEDLTPTNGLANRQVAPPAFHPANAKASETWASPCAARRHYSRLCHYCESLIALLVKGLSETFNPACR